MSVEDLQRPPETAVRCAILTVSDTRTPDTDTSGRLIRDLLTTAGHLVAERALVPDDPQEVSRIVTAWTDARDIRIVITTGGTGISRRDSTFEAVTHLFSKELTGFGELFRTLSFQEIGSGAMLSRATAGIVDRSAVFMLPGSEGAVRLAMTRLIIPQLTHIARELEK
jgi:molybdenum cofactor biosynthesis protein B